MLPVEFKGKKGPASVFSPVDMFNAKLIKGAKVIFSFDKNYNTGIAMSSGSMVD